MAQLGCLLEVSSCFVSMQPKLPGLSESSDFWDGSDLLHTTQRCLSYLVIMLSPRALFDEILALRF